MSKIYGYARCSLAEEKGQDLNRQVRELKAAGAEEIITEREHGDARVKQNLDLLLETAKAGDTIITLEVSRLSRSTQQLCEIARFASACRRTADYLKRGEECGSDCVQVAVFGRAFADLTPLRHSIEAAVSEETVYDDASPALHNVRRQMQALHEQIKEKLNHILKSKKAYLADSYISIRGDHYVLPVLKRFKNDFGYAHLHQWSGLRILFGYGCRWRWTH